MISSSLFVLLLATYAYSIPVGDNLMIKNPVPQVTTSESVVLNLLDDGESKNVVNLGETTSTTILKNGLPLTTQNSLLNNERVTRGMVESSTLDSTFETTSEPKLRTRGVEDSFTTSEPMESSSLSGFGPRGVQEPLTTSEPKLRARGVEDSFTTSETMESSTGSELRPRGVEDLFTTSEPMESSTGFGRVPRGVEDSFTTSETFESSTGSELRPRGIEDSFTTLETIESSTGSELRPRGVEDLFTTSEPMESSTGFGRVPRGVEDSFTTSEPIESSTGYRFRTRETGKLDQIYPTLFESADQFNAHAIRGENDKLDMDLQTTEEPLSSSVTSFATTTGLLRGTRGEQSEDVESSSMQMDDLTTGQSKTVIEVFAGPNTKAEIIPGKNTKTEVVPGDNTKTEIISPSGDKIEVIKSGSNKLAGEQQQQPLSEGKN